MGRRSSAQAGRAVLMPPGPLAAWRLSLAVGTSFLLTGLPLVRAARDHMDLDVALMRSLAAAAFVWIVLGGVNRVLASAEAERLAAARLEAQVQAIMDAAAARELLDDGGDTTVDPLQVSAAIGSFDAPAPHLLGRQAGA